MNWLKDKLFGAAPFAELSVLFADSGHPGTGASAELDKGTGTSADGEERSAASSRHGLRAVLKNLPGSLPVLVADYVQEVLGRPVLLVAESVEDAEEYVDDLTALSENDKSQTSNIKADSGRVAEDLNPARRGGENSDSGHPRTGASAVSEKFEVCLLPGRPQFHRELTAIEQSERAEVLMMLAKQERPLIVATTQALLDPLPQPGEVEKNSYVISRGESLARDSLIKYLVDGGYKRDMFVEAVGQFAVRGAVVDVYPFGAQEPVRIEFLDDEVESLRHFDPSSQKSTGEVNDVTMMTGIEPLVASSNLLEHISADTVIIWAGGRAGWQALKRVFEEVKEGTTATKYRKLAERMLDVEDPSVIWDEEDEKPETGNGKPENEDFGIADDFDVAPDGSPQFEDSNRPETGNLKPEHGDDEDEDSGQTGESASAERGGASLSVHRSSLNLVDVEVIRRASRKFANLFLENSPANDDPVIDFHATPQERFAANLPLVADRLKEYHATGITTIILADSQLAGDRLAQVLVERGCPEHAFTVHEGGLHHGFSLPSAKVAVLVDHDIFGRMRRRRRFMKFKNVVPLHDIDSLKPGDFVVHIDYGIGRYQGLGKINVNGTMREVLRIIYKDDIALFVKLENLAQVQKYSAREGFHPPLSKIGGREWKELKNKTKKSLLSIAEDLIKLYATRKQARGHIYGPDTLWQKEMEASFPYEDTPDQLNAAEEVKRDMEKNLPMDRLVVGDVGYGKTEVAMRAAFKAVTDGKQVAVLVPTTILAMQHFRTFKERFKNWPVKIEVMSRFQNVKEQKLSVKRLGEGQCDVLIGTHRILSKDIEFSELGLLIIDEEHRFGVVQKERIKTLRSNIDVLSMSATPIPRTLHMALMGARDLSQISTPPPGRLPIETDVVEFSEKVIKEAIEYELARSGQVFFVHNRVQSIPAVKRMLERLLPETRFGIAHGQMEEDQLSRVMIDFIEGDIQVLISTMIIESGIDLPNVNTMIVNRADRFGVAQLHQLRGRIGRSSRKAYAYLLVPPKFEMTKIARERLAALTNFSSLGAGFQVAMRDLEIRGAGNLLGREQSGYINAVGFEMYQRLIEEAVREVQLEQLGKAADEQEPVELKLRLDADAFFPEPYMPEGSMRLNYYRELSKASQLSRVEEIAEDVRDRFGKLPEPAENLMDMVRVRVLGEKLGCEKIEINPAEMVLEYPKGQMTREKLLEIASKSGGYPVEFAASGPVKIKLPLGQIKTGWRERLSFVLGFLGKVSEEKAETLTGEKAKSL